MFSIIFIYESRSSLRFLAAEFFVYGYSMIFGNVGVMYQAAKANERNTGDGQKYHDG